MICTASVTDIGRLAVAQFEAERQEIIARAVVRRVLKKAAIYATKDALAVNQGLANLALDAGGVVWEATEKADTRCWGLLPESIQVLRLELPAGTHRLTLRPARDGQPVGAAQATEVEVIDGLNTYVMASFPTPNLVGRILTSQQPRSPAPVRPVSGSPRLTRTVAEPSETATYVIR